MEFKELALAELDRGYSRSNSGECTCIFCGETFDEELIYTSRDRLVNGKRAVREHIIDVHGGTFNALIELDKQISGLTDVQKTVLEGLYENKSNKELSEEMGISLATVRTHKFNIQKMKREAKILLALLDQIEDEEIVESRRKLESDSPQSKASEMKEFNIDKNREYAVNNLHPFFTTFNLK